jgi:dihydroorotase-like cyclic amidohydrolase
MLLRGGTVVDGSGSDASVRDVAVDGGSIAEVGPELDPGGARHVIDASGLYVIPGIVDPHVHVSGGFGASPGFRMMVRGGVTAALDLAGDPPSIAQGLAASGCGMSVATVYPIVPGDTVSGRDPSSREIGDVLDAQLASGAIGLKVLGGHYPLTPDATRRVIEACAERGAYCAFHAGTTETGSDIRGVEEAVELAGDLPLHLAHVNSYCRGQIAEPVEEAARALRAVGAAPNVRSESYLATINGAVATCRDGAPVSDVVKTCLRLGGYAPTRAGLEDAIRGAWALVHEERDGEVVLAEPDQGIELFQARDTEIGVSFPVNPAASQLALALARRPGGGFVVDAFSSDGGSLPRNTTLRQGVGLVQAGALTLAELVEKGCTQPAAMLGLARKARIAPSYDADVVAVDGEGTTRLVLIGGRVVFAGGQFLAPYGGTLMCGPRGAPSLPSGVVRQRVPGSLGLAPRA